MKTRIIGALLAVLLAGVGAFLLVGYVNGADARAAAGSQPSQVYIVQQPIPKGTAGELVKDFVKVDTVPKRNIAPGGVTDLAQLNGLIAGADVFPGEQLLRPQFVDPLQAAERGDVAVPAGMQSLSFTLPIERVVGGAVHAGDHVGMIATVVPGGPTSKFAFTHVLVTKVQGLAVGQDGKTAATQASGTVLMVTIALDTHDAERWVWAANGGASIWLTLENAKTDTGGSSPVNGSNIYG